MTAGALLVDAFIVVYLFVAWSWGQSSDSWLGRAVAPFTSAVLWLGLGQTWGMFAPDPAMLEGHLNALITLTDGNTLEWSTPRMASLSPGQAFLKFRHQKYEASVLDGDTAYLRPALAEYLLQRYAERGAVKVDLVYEERGVPAPGESPAAAHPARAQVFETYPEPDEAE